MYSPAIEELIKVLKRLPSVGEHTAERFVFHWLKSGKKEVSELILALKNVMDNIKSCELCWNFTDTSPCSICSNPKRDQTTVMVIAKSQDLQVMENTGEYNGIYHVVRGALDATNDNPLEKTKLPELLDRVKKGQIKEIILALNPDIKGETTMLYLEREIKKQEFPIKVTRLARGLPMGSDIEYADEITLASALQGRREK